MTECELVLVRHGETPWNRDRRLQGHIDIDLNEEGRRQARAVAVRLARERVDALYTSDLRRARKTADAIALATGVTVQPDPSLRERNYGVLEGHRLDELSERFPVEYAQWQARQPHAEIERGETLAAFHARICASVERIARLHPGQRVVVTAHGGVLDCVYRLASGTALEAKRSWDLLNASINCVRYDGHRFALGAWADVTHLVGDGLDEVDRRYA